MPEASHQTPASVCVVVDATAESPEMAALLRTTVCGEPLFLHASYAAASAKSASRVLIISNDPRICEIAANRSLPSSLREGAKPTVSFDLLKQSSFAEDLLVCLSGSVPLVSSDDIDRFVSHFLNADCDALLSSFATPGVPDGMTPNGALDVFRSSALLKTEKLSDLALAAAALPPFHAVRIEAERDLIPLSALLKRQPLDAILRMQPIHALILDFDGVFTDNKVIVAAEGSEAAICDRSDGFAIQGLQRRGFPILVLSTEKVPIVRARSQKLGLVCIHGVGDKLANLNTWLQERKISLEHAIYVGNDVNDLECMRAVGIPIAVADAFPEARRAARVILASRGGNGAVREIAMAVSAALDRQG